MQSEHDSPAREMKDLATGQSPSPLTRPSPALRAARWILLSLVAASLLGVGASLALAPTYVPSHIEDFPLNPAWTPELIQAALDQLGWPASTVAWFEFLRGFMAYLSTLLPGLLILRRKSQDWFGLYVAFAFIVVPALTAIRPVAGLLPGLMAAGQLAGALGWQLYFILFYVFPDGRFVPRWTRWLLPLWLAVNLIAGWFAGPDAQSGIFERFPGLILIPFALVFSAIGSQIYRYFRRSNAAQRQQTKWVVFALAAAMACTFWLGSAIQRPAADGQALGMTLMLELGRLAVVNMGFIVVPIAIAVAILRYRLWDVDVIIRRTLIYSALTAVLALTYFGSVLVLGSVFRFLTGQGQNSLVVVLSTLAIAALFVPLRSRVQRAIDRRFFRQKYNAARTLAGFAVAARDEVDLDRLSAQLVDVVQDSMEPEQVSLWLRPASRPVHASHRGNL